MRVVFLIFEYARVEDEDKKKNCEEFPNKFSKPTKVSADVCVRAQYSETRKKITQNGRIFALVVSVDK